jgi:hypothetical protein
MDTQIIEVIEIARPAGTFIDFLQRNHVRGQSIQQRSDAPEVHLQLSLRSQALDWIESATVRDVERNEAQARHRAHRLKPLWGELASGAVDRS